jgi:hypothetical protein
LQPKVQISHFALTRGHTKAAAVTASKKQEVTMKLITRFELAAKNENELYGLHKKAFNELAKSRPKTLERVNALASLENIERELSSRMEL